MRLKYWLVTLAFLLAQTFLVASVSAHEIDHEHDHDECQICVIVASYDDAPPIDQQAFKASDLPLWSGSLIPVATSISAADYRLADARAPPL